MSEYFPSTDDKRTENSAIDDNHPSAPGEEIIVGRWLCFGPFAMCWDTE